MEVDMAVNFNSNSVWNSELFVMFSNSFTAKFEFKGNVDIGKIGRAISQYVL